MTHDHELLLQTLTEFTHALVRPYDVDTVLGELAERVTEVLGLAGTGISLAEGGGLRLDMAIPSEVTALETHQNTAFAGPCVDAFTSRRIVAVDDLAADGRWPEFSSLAAELEINAVAGIPMVRDGSAVGVLNMYARGTRQWSPQDLAAASLMADMATGYLLNAAQLDQEQRVNEQLQRALDSRVVIEQAKGIVAAMRGLSVEDAFKVLRSHARGSGRSLREVAEDIVRGDLRV